MSSSHRLLAPTLAACAATILAPTAARAQGPLTPSGAPVPTMKTLAQVEPRTPISAPGSITQSGSYYLTGNLAVSSGDGIVIAADNVTLDLNGHTISSSVASPTGAGINISGARTQISVLNGHIRSGVTFAGGGSYTGTGFNFGLVASNTATNIRVRDLTVTGVLNTGIEVPVADNSSVVESCIVRTAQSYGTRAGAVSNSVALLVGTGGPAIVANTATNSFGTLTAGGTAVQTPGATVQSVADAVNALPGTVADKRQPLSAAGTISAAGSYYLTGNITSSSGNAFSILASGVTLDLNGYTIDATANTTGTGIFINSNVQNVRIRNGHILCSIVRTGSTFTPGTFQAVRCASGTSAIQVSDLTVSGVGTGIDLSNSPGSLVQNCSVAVSSGAGINAINVINCTARDCFGSGITGDVVTNCVGESVNSYGIRGGQVFGSRGRTETTNAVLAGLFATTATQCVGIAIAGNVAGIRANDATGCEGTGAGTGDGILASIALNSRGTSPGGNGIQATEAATNCFGLTATGIGVSATLANGCYGRATGAGTGITATTGSGCFGFSTAGTAVSITNKYNMP